MYVFRERQAAGTSAAVGRVDLLTVLAHEIGHSLGLTDEADAPHNVMADVIGLSTRRVPRPELESQAGVLSRPPAAGDAARDLAFRRLAIDAAEFTTTAQIRFTSFRSGRAPWLADVDEFFAGGLEL